MSKVEALGTPVSTGDRVINDYPKVDIYRCDTSLYVKAAVPGMKKEDILVELELGSCILSIMGSTQLKLNPIEDCSEEANKYVVGCSYANELKKASFNRSVTLPVRLSITDMNAVTAKLEDGILTIEFKDAYVKEEEEDIIIPIDIK